MKVDNSQITPLYENTTPGLVADATKVDPAIAAIIVAVNTNDDEFINFKTALELPIPDQSIVTRHLRNLAVTDPKLAVGAVTTAKIADGAISTAKLADMSVTAAKIANGTITEPKYGTGSVSSRAIANSSITAVKLDPSILIPPEISILASFDKRGIDVTDPRWGAKGDGVTDDTAALQSALNYVSSSGGKAIFPPGVYKKSEILYITGSSVVIEFMPGANIIETVKGKNGFHVNDNLTNIRFDGLSLYGVADSTASSASYAISLGTGSQNISLSNCRFDGYTGGILTVYENKNIIVSGCSFYNMIYIPDLTAGGYGIVYQAAKFTKTVNCYFDSSVYRHSIYMGRNPGIDADGHDHVIDGCTFLGDSQNTYITGFEYRLKIMGNSNVSVIGNNFSGGVGHILITSTQTVNPDCKNIVLSGNTFADIKKGNSTHAYGISADGPGTYLENSVISNNVFRNFDCAAHIGLNLAKNVIIIGNSIMSAIAGHGIVGQNKIEDVLIQGNVIRGLTSASRGIYLNNNSTISDPTTYSLNVTIRGNDLGSMQFGIYFTTTLTAIIENNLIELTTQQSIYFANIKFTGIIRNNALRNGNSAIHFNSLCVDPIWVYGNVLEGQTVNQIENDGNAYLCEPINNGRTTGTGTNKRTWVLSAAPTSGTWKAGDEAGVLNKVAGGYGEYACITGGTPGTWKGVGLIQA